MLYATTFHTVLRRFLSSLGQSQAHILSDPWGLCPENPSDQSSATSILEVAT